MFFWKRNGLGQHGLGASGAPEKGGGAAPLPLVWSQLLSACSVRVGQRDLLCWAWGWRRRRQRERVDLWLFGAGEGQEGDTDPQPPPASCLPVGVDDLFVDGPPCLIVAPFSIGSP